MRQRRALRIAGRAAGELDVDRIVARQRRAERVELAPCPVARGRASMTSAKLSMPGVSRVAHADHVRRSGQPRGVQFARRRRRRVPARASCSISRYIDVLNCSAAIDRLAADLVQRVLEFGQPIRRVDVDQHRADARGRELRQQPFDAVRRPDADAVALHDAEREQPGRQDVDFFGELLPRPADALLAETRPPDDRGNARPCRARNWPTVASLNGMSVEPRT